MEQTEEELLILGGDFKARIGEEGNLYNGEEGNIGDQWSYDSHNRTQLTELEFYLGNRVEFDYWPLIIVIRLEGKKIEEEKV